MDAEDGEKAPFLFWFAEHPGAQWEAVTHLKTPPFNTSYADTIRAQLTLHGCQIDEQPDHAIITLPPGSLRRLRGPVTMMARYTIRFPDGFEIYEQYEHARDISIIALFKP